MGERPHPVRVSVTDIFRPATPGYGHHPPPRKASGIEASPRCRRRPQGCIRAPLTTLSTALRGPCTAKPTRSRSSRGPAPTAARLSASLPGREQVGGEHRRAAARGRGRDRARRANVSVAGEDHHRLAEHRQVGGAVGVGVGLADQLGGRRGDPADEEGGDVQGLPGGEVVAQQDGDLGVEALLTGPASPGRAAPVLYVPGVAGPAEHVRAWRPAVPGVTEVFHARFTEHAYPSHTHDAWTLLIVDDGAVRYDLDRHEHGALPTR